MKTSLEILREKIQAPGQATMVETLGIEIQALEKDYLRATMPVDGRTTQYFGMLHGGASVALAESLASIGAFAHLDPAREIAVGLEINANHVRGVPAGEKVTGEARPVHVGRKTQVWQIEIKNAEGKLVCTSRCTIAVVPKA